MIRLSHILVAAACALPLVAGAQSTTGTTSPNVKPADQPRTKLESDATTKNGDATKYGGPGTDTGGAMTKDDPAHSKMKKSTKSTTTPPAGEVPTYPAPAKDGTPTK